MTRTHALWCTDLTDMITGCDGSVCYQGSEYHVTSATGMPTRRDDYGQERHSDIRLMPVRALDDTDVADTHIIQLNVELRGWNEDNWVGLTTNEARQLLGQLGDCLALCNADRAALQQPDDVLRLATRLVEHFDELDESFRQQLAEILGLPTSEVTA